MNSVPGGPHMCLGSVWHFILCICHPSKPSQVSDLCKWRQFPLMWFVVGWPTYLHLTTSSGIWLPSLFQDPANFTPCSRGTDSKSPKTGRKIFCRQPLLLALCPSSTFHPRPLICSLSLKGEKKKENMARKRCKWMPQRLSSDTWVYGFCTSVIKGRNFCQW